MHVSKAILFEMQETKKGLYVSVNVRHTVERLYSGEKEKETGLEGESNSKNHTKIRLNYFWFYFQIALLIYMLRLNYS